MAFSSSSSRRNVFLNFRREDTGRTFVSHLYRSLDRKEIPTYKDVNQQMRHGKISHEVAKAIRESTIFVVVISENYASSAWCLEVLAEITELSRRIEIKTVFYEVDPEVLTRRRTGKFADDFRRQAERESWETMFRWNNALERLNTTGHKFCSRDCVDDSKMLDDLIISISSPIPDPYPRVRLNMASTSLRKKLALPSQSDVGLKSSVSKLMGDITKYQPKSQYGSGQSGLGLERFSHKDTSVTKLMGDSKTTYQPKSLDGSGQTGLGLERFAHEDTSVTNPVSDNTSGLVGMYRHKKAVYGLLDLESKNQVLTVGIWGFQGVGKTTLAECVFDDISGHFQHHCFLTKVDKIYQNRISPSLLNHLPSTKSFYDVFDAIKPSLVNRRVLLVIDGVDDTSEQIRNTLKVTRWLGPGSRVIMTSTFDSYLESCGVKYKMECLRYEEALQLFSVHAFKRTYPLNGFEPYSIRAVHFAGCLPLALKVLGSFLYGKDEESWKRTLRELEESQDNGSRQVSIYIGAGEYLLRRQTESEQYVRPDEEEECSPSYNMLL